MFTNVGLTQKKASCVFLWHFWCQEYKASCSHAYVLTFFIFLEAPHDIFTSLQLSAECVQDRKLKHLENVCVLSDVHIWTAVSLLVLLCFRFVFVSLVWTHPKNMYGWISWTVKYQLTGSEVSIEESEERQVVILKITCMMIKMVPSTKVLDTVNFITHPHRSNTRVYLKRGKQSWIKEHNKYDIINNTLISNTYLIFKKINHIPCKKYGSYWYVNRAHGFQNQPIKMELQIKSLWYV